MIKQAKLARNKDLNVAEQKWGKIEKLQKIDWDFLVVNNVFGSDGFQKMLVYQPTFSMLDYKQIGSK